MQLMHEISERDLIRHRIEIRATDVYCHIAITMEGVKEILGMWAAETEGAIFWLSVLTELKNVESGIYLSTVLMD